MKDELSATTRKNIEQCIWKTDEFDKPDMNALKIDSEVATDKDKFPKKNPLSDSDIFKAQFYKFYTSIGKKDAFIDRWKQLEDQCEKIYHPLTGTPMDEAFTRYFDMFL